MIHATPSISKLLKGQSKLPDPLKQSALILEFREPTREIRMSEFYRIRLSELMLTGGEDKHYMASIWQNDRVNQMKRCPLCRQPALQQAANVSRCMNQKCPNRNQLIFGGPASGVVHTVVDPSWIVEEEIVEIEYEDGSKYTVTHDLTTHVLIALDRRYSERVLSQVKRCAFNLAEMLFMPLKD